MVSCQKGDARHADADRQIGPFWQDTLELPSVYLLNGPQHVEMSRHPTHLSLDDYQFVLMPQTARLR